VHIGFTYPEDRLGVARHRVLHPAIRVGTRVMRATLPRRVPLLAARAGAQALMLHHAVVSAATVERAHALGIAVWAWTVDYPHELERMLRAGVDAVITNDPRILTSS
jgi:glycerophosphoryl diester phosphodiesterase